MKIRTVSMFKTGQPVYVDCPPLALVVEDEKTSMRCNKLLPRTNGPFIVMDVKSDVIAIDENSIPNPISIEKATLVPLKAHVRHE